MSGTKAIDDILKNQELLSALAERVYEKLKDDIVIKKLEENSNSIREFLEVLKKNTEAIASLQEAVNRHTEAIQSLQEAVKRQGEAIASLQEAVNRHTEAIQSLQEAVKRQGEAIASLQEAVREHSKVILKLMEGQRKLSVEIGSFTSRAGKGLEKTILNIYKKALKLHHIDTTKIKHGSIVDELGLIEKGRSFEIDFYETNDYVYVFEVKNFADEAVVDQIIIRKKLLEAKYKKPVKAFVVANYVEKEVKQALEKEGAEIIFSHEVE